MIRLFTRILFSRNFTYEKFRENKTLAKNFRNYSARQCDQFQSSYDGFCHIQTKHGLMEPLRSLVKVSKGAKIRNRYNQAPHLTQDTNGKVTNSQSDTTHESQEVSPFPAGDHKAQINRRARTHNKNKANSTNLYPPTKGY